MSKAVKTIMPDATVEQAATAMRNHNVGILPVVEAGKLYGVVTDRDLVLRGIATGRNPRLTTVREVMTPNVLHCYGDQSITEVVKLMEKNRLRRLVVRDRHEQLLGVVSLSDLAVHLTNERVSGHLLGKLAA
jgi:CBS domain-containing protein